MASSPELPPAPPATAPPPPAAPCWTAILKTKPPLPAQLEAIPSRVFGTCNSSKGISVAVVDANAIIHGDKLIGSADKFVTLKEVLDEVRDPVSRHRMSFLPLTVETMEPSPDCIKKAVKFARETGDLQTLSDVDLKLIALAYMLESQIHGTGHLRDSPPPLRVVNVRRLEEVVMPGWGKNVPNLAEWEALEQVADGGLNHGSRVLPLKDLGNNVVPVSSSDSVPGEQDCGHRTFVRPRRFTAPKKEINIEGKKMVAAGIDASHGEDTENADDWKPAVSRSTHRRFLRRKARREMLEALEESEMPSEEGTVVDLAAPEDGTLSDDEEAHPENEVFENGLLEKNPENEVFENGLLEKTPGEVDVGNADLDVSEPVQEDISPEDVGPDAHETDNLDDIHLDMEGDEIGACTNDLQELEISSQADGSTDISAVDDASSEQSLMLRSLSDSTVACVTTDFAMQNVILQIGLRLLAPGGMQIRQLHRWVLKCHACNKVTQEIGRIFCPKCGNGGTLRKVSVTVGENGIVLADRRQRNFIRGTKFSLPMPQGGRDAITKNPILREDQLPHKLLHPKTKKKQGSEDEFLSTVDMFSHSGEKRAPLQPPVRKALAMFSGRRNPNDNHFSRAKH